MVEDSNRIPAIVKELDRLRSQEVAMGVTGKEASRDRGDGLTMADLAMIHQNGASIDVTPAMRAYLHTQGIHLRAETTQITIPARPHIDVGVERVEGQIGGIVQNGVGSLLDGDLGASQLLDLVGQAGASGIRDYVSNPNTPPPPNSGATEAMKGSSNPLVDTSRYVNSITFQRRRRGVI